VATGFSGIVAPPRYEFKLFRVSFSVVFKTILADTGLFLTVPIDMTYNNSVLALSTNKMRVINVILPLLILGDMVYYQFCFSSCAYLKGSLLGVDMKVVGLLMPIPLILVALLKWDLLYLLGLSFGMGGEIKLISYQIGAGIFCPYCLTAAFLLFLLFLFNFDKSRPGLAALFMVIGFFVFQFFFRASVFPSYGLFPVFFNG
jgi:hypothetical protein